MTDFTKLQVYLLKRMQAFQRLDNIGISVFSWMTEFESSELEVDLPDTFTLIEGLKFPTACAWADMDEGVIVTWRNLSVQKGQFVHLYKFDNRTRMNLELQGMILNPEGWLYLGEEAL